MSTQAVPSLRHAFLIGGMKCGTWTLFKLLRKHPAIAGSKPKELKYFTRAAFGDWGDYHSNFTIRPRTKVLLEGTVQYSRHPATKDSAYKIAHFDPRAKFIYMMRDPVARIESQLAHRIARREIVHNDEERAAEITRAISFSRYFTQVGTFANLFGEEQLYLQTFERFIHYQPSVASDIYKFLQLRVPEEIEALPPQNVRRNDNDADRFALTDDEVTTIRESLDAEVRSLTTAFGVDTSTWRRFWGDNTR